MRTINDYCQAAMIRQDIKSLRELGDKLGTSQTLPSQWKTGRAWPSDSTMKKLANLAGIREDIALLELAIWRTTEDARPIYEHILKAITKGAAAILVMVGLNAIPSGKADATETSNVTTTTSIHYATFCYGRAADIKAVPSPHSPVGSGQPVPPTRDRRPMRPPGCTTPKRCSRR